MRPKSHYTILGISSSESPGGIREAYLRLVKALHPDHAGEASTQAFREVQQAYDVLSDPQSRRSYDEQLARKRPARPWHTTPSVRRRHIEPLVPDEPLAARRRAVRSRAYDDLWERSFADLTPLGTYSRLLPEVVELDVTLPYGLVAQSGAFTVDIPIPTPCRACGGSGIHWPFSCRACGQRGWIAGGRSLRLNVPPGIRHGTVVEVQPEGTDEFLLRVRLLFDKRKRAPPIW